MTDRQAAALRLTQTFGYGFVTWYESINSPNRL
jgi:hypothetical protein